MNYTKDKNRAFFSVVRTLNYFHIFHALWKPTFCL